MLAPATVHVQQDQPSWDQRYSPGAIVLVIWTAQMVYQDGSCEEQPASEAFPGNSGCAMCSYHSHHKSTEYSPLSSTSQTSPRRMIALHGALDLCSQSRSIPEATWQVCQRQRRCGRPAQGQCSLLHLVDAHRAPQMKIVLRLLWLWRPTRAPAPLKRPPSCTPPCFNWDTNSCSARSFCVQITMHALCLRVDVLRTTNHTGHL